MGKYINSYNKFVKLNEDIMSGKTNPEELKLKNINDQILEKIKKYEPNFFNLWGYNIPTSNTYIQFKNLSKTPGKNYPQYRISSVYYSTQNNTLAAQDENNKKLSDEILADFMSEDNINKIFNINKK